MWDALDEEYGRKVEYVTSTGHSGTVYLSAEIAPEVYTGTNKHTDEPVTVRWTGLHYEEVTR